MLGVEFANDGLNCAAMENPYQVSEQPVNQTEVQANGANVGIVQPLYRIRGWLKFFAVLAHLSGALSVISIVGIIFCWLYFWVGALLWGASTRLEQGYENDDSELLAEGCAKLGRVIKIMGICAVITIGLYVALLVPMIVSPAVMHAVTEGR